MCIRSDRIWPKGRMKIDTDGFWQRSWAVVVINRREMRHADDIEAGECFIEDLVAHGWGQCVYWRTDHGTGLAKVDLPCMAVYTNGWTVYWKLWVSLVCVTCITWPGTLIRSICRVCLYAWDWNQTLTLRNRWVRIRLHVLVAVVRAEYVKH